MIILLFIIISHICEWIIIIINNNNYYIVILLVSTFLSTYITGYQYLLINRLFRFDCEEGRKWCIRDTTWFQFEWTKDCRNVAYNSTDDNRRYADILLVYVIVWILVWICWVEREIIFNFELRLWSVIRVLISNWKTYRGVGYIFFPEAL